MQSPFPGMDPYLEQFWPDLHARLILYACDLLEEQLPSNLIARVEERVVLEADEEPHVLYPDVKITERPGRASPANAARSRAAVVEPLIVPYRPEPATETFLTVLEAGPGQRLVTVIEILSLSNKLAGPDLKRYHLKQLELAAARASLVEIDLLRQGRSVLNAARSRIPRQARTPYQACVRRGWLPEQCEVYPMPLRRPLPPIRIPLRQKDEDVQLDLQALLDQAYRKGRYYLTINYAEPPDPPLTEADAKWARARIKAARRSKPERPS